MLPAPQGAESETLQNVFRLQFKGSVLEIPAGSRVEDIFKLGEVLEQHGHEVQYFGMEHEGRCVGNRVNAYTSDMDFHGGSKLSKLE